MKTLNLLSLCMLVLCLFLVTSCDKVEDLTSTTVRIKDFEVKLPDEVTPGSGGGTSVNVFSGEETIDRSVILGDYASQISKIKSISADSVTITIGSSTYGTFVRNFTLYQQYASPQEYAVTDDYVVGSTHKSDALTKFAVSVLNSLIDHETLVVKYSGETDIPSGTKIMHQLKFYGVKIKGNLIEL